MNMQKKFLEGIASRVRELEIDFIQEANFVNCGKVYLQTADFRNVVSFAYNFQDAYAKIQVYPEGKEVVSTCGFTHRDCILDAYVRYAESQKFVEVADSIVGKVREAVNGRSSS